MLRQIFEKGFDPQEIQLYRLAQSLTPDQKEAVEKFLVARGMVCGGSTAQYGGFLGMLASIGVPLAIELVTKMFRKGLQVRPRRSLPFRGKGMQVSPPPFFGRWEDYVKK